MAACLMAACSNGSSEGKTAVLFDPASVKADISAVNQKFEEALLKGDSAGIVALYHADAKIFPPNMEACNRNAVGSMVATMPKMGIKTFKLNTSEVSGGPDEVVETGNYEMGDSTKVTESGKYIVVWKKDGDSWKLYRDIWNSNKPAPAGK